jgi:hypothetical protein
VHQDTLMAGVPTAATTAPPELTRTATAVDADCSCPLSLLFFPPPFFFPALLLPCTFTAAAVHKASENMHATENPRACTRADATNTRAVESSDSGGRRAASVARAPHDAAMQRLVVGANTKARVDPLRRCGCVTEGGGRMCR